MKEKRESVVQNACHLLARTGIDSGSAGLSVDLLAGDGSQRCFYRLRIENGKGFVAIAPGEESQQGMEEAYSSWQIGNHLRGKNIPVPRYLAFDDKTGLIISEDLGDVRLYEYVRERNITDKDVKDLYKQIIRELVGMQVKGAEEFQASWCYQTARYDRKLMIERESEYFADALCRKYLHINSLPSSVNSEFLDIADQVSQAPAHFFLHRDFQSRNIMIKEGRARFIDFQGGRFGPLGYDLASLLIDPYIGIPGEMQEELFAVYVQELQSRLDYSSEEFLREYRLLSLQRNLQILGAFAYLSHQKGKMFFQPFIRPALYSLKNILGKPECMRYASLNDLVRTCLKKLESTLPST